MVYRSCLKQGVENQRFLIEVGYRFQGLGHSPPTKYLGNDHPPPPVSSQFIFDTITGWEYIIQFFLYIFLFCWFFKRGLVPVMYRVTSLLLENLPGGNKARGRGAGGSWKVTRL